MSTRTKHLAAAYVRTFQAQACSPDYCPHQRAEPKPVSEGTASAKRINAAPLPVRCAHFPACTYPEGQCAELCLPGGLKP